VSNNLNLRRWIAWKLAQLSWRADPTAHYQQKIELVDKVSGDVWQTLTVEADAYGAGVSSSTGRKYYESMPFYLRTTDDDGTEW
jgi:hypothetical protein